MTEVNVTGISDVVESNTRLQLRRNAGVETFIVTAVRLIDPEVKLLSSNDALPCWRREGAENKQEKFIYVLLPKLIRA